MSLLLALLNPTGSSGTISVTLNNDSSAITATTTILGTLSKQESGDTSNIQGSIGDSVSGTLVVTNANDTAGFQGTSTIIGTISKINGYDVGVFSGTTIILGTLAKTNNNDIMTASGTVGAEASSRWWNRLTIAVRNSL